MRKLILSNLIILATFTSQAQKEEITLQSLESLHAFGPFEVTLMKADEARLEIDYNGIDADEIDIKISGGEVRLKIKTKHFTRDWNSPSWDDRIDRYAKVTVYFNDLHEVEAKAGARIKSPNKIKSKYLYLTCTMGAEMNLDVKSKKLEVVSSMGSDLRLTGETEILELSAKMGSNVKASQLISQATYVKASMGSDVSVYASEKLEVSSGFGATVNYTGGPSVRHESKTFGGEIYKRR